MYQGLPGVTVALNDTTSARLTYQGCEAAARRQGKHKLRVWLNVSSSGLKILDERTGVSSHPRSNHTTFHC